MEQNHNKRRTGQNVAFYTALAVCLIAVGAGAWELLQPEQSKGNAASAAAALPGGAGNAVSGPASLPDGGVPDIPANGAADIAESPSDADGGAVSGENGAEASATNPAGTVSGAASVPADSKAQSGKASGDKPKDTGADGKTSGEKPKDGNANGKASGEKPKDSNANGKTSGGKPKESNANGKTSDAKPKDNSAKNSKNSQADKSKPSGDAVRPVEGQTVTSFSMDKLLYNETMRDWRTHDGIDIAADAGTAVVAARPGTVESVDADPIMGTTVTLRHEGAWESVYASLADMPEVEAGDEVTAGQVLGFVGDTAASEASLGPHLHFSALRDGAPVDPEIFLA